MRGLAVACALAATPARPAPPSSAISNQPTSLQLSTQSAWNNPGPDPLGPEETDTAADYPGIGRITEQDRIVNLLRPARVETVALAPDGGHLAYVAVDSHRVQIILIDLGKPEAPASVEVGQGDWWRRHEGSGWAPPQVTFLRWASGSRLVFAEGDNGVYAVNADGKGLTTLATALDVGMPRGQGLSDLQQSAPPGMAQPPSQLDLMPGSPPVNLDPMLKVQPGETIPNAPAAGSGQGLYAGQQTVDPPSTHDLDTADPRSDDYIGMAFRPSRAIEGDTGPEPPGELIPRSPQVVAMPPDDPDHLILAASLGPDSLTGQYAFGLYRVAIATGQRQKLGEATVPGNAVLFDRAGHLRVVLGAVGRTYLHVFPSRSLWRGAKPLDQAVRDPQLRGFRSRPDSFFGARAIPVGFDYDPNLLYFATNLGRDTVGLYALNLKSGQRTNFAVESPDFDVVNPTAPEAVTGAFTQDDPLVFDPQLRRLVGVRLASPTPATRWLDPGLAQIQLQLDQRFPDRTAELLQWDRPRTRFLVRVTGPADPGRYYVYAPEHDQLLLCARRAPWIASGEVCGTAPFTLTAADGTTLTGTVTVARNARIHPAPLVVLCPDGPGQTPPTGFDSEAQAFAGMGFEVLRVNYRGSGSLGANHLGAIRRGIDQVPLGDILAALDFARVHAPFDPKRVAMVGEGFGGYLALRAVELHPERFRSAVTIGAPVDLNQWVHESDLLAHAQVRADDAAALASMSAEQQANPFTPLDAIRPDTSPPGPPRADPPAVFLAKARLAFFGANTRGLAAISPDHFPQDLIRPIFMVEDGTADRAYLAAASSLRLAVKRQGGEASAYVMDGPFALLPPAREAKVLTQIEAFLNLNFYSYNVEIGDVKARD